MTNIAFRRECDIARLPVYKTIGSSGADLFSIESVVLKPGDIRAISTGLQLAFCSPGLELQIRTRSGMALKGVIVANSPGTCDFDFRGTVKVILMNVSPDDYAINIGDRIAQMVVQKVEQYQFEFTEEVQATERGAGGFGSTGMK